MMKIVKNLYKKDVIHYNKKDLIFLLLSASWIILTNVQTYALMKLLEGTNYNLMINNIIICTIIILINIYCFKNRIIINKNTGDIKALQEENKNLLEVNDNIRCFKHDFNNIIQAIDGYIYLDDMKSLAVYFKSLLKECNHVNTVDRLNAKIVDNPAIYGVLLDKYKIAENKNIKMNVDILTSLKELGERSYVISRMLGILIDNALEASCECEKKVVNIQILKDLKKKRINILVENTYINKNVDTNRIFEKNYSTKKGNSGLGLWKIQDILSKDTSLDLFTSKDEEMFKQQLEIYENV